jgi:hypothetical protein
MNHPSLLCPGAACGQSRTCRTQGRAAGREQVRCRAVRAAAWAAPDDLELPAAERQQPLSACKLCCPMTCSMCVSPGQTSDSMSARTSSVQTQQC